MESALRFVECVSDRQKALKAARQLFGPDWLREVNVGALRGVLRGARLIRAAQNDDGQVRELRVAAKEAAEFVAAEVRHDGVCDDRVHVRRERGLQRLD